MLDTAADIVGNFDVTMDTLFVLREGALDF